MTLTVVYTFLIVFLGLLINNNSSKQRNSYILFSGLILILVSGLRSIYVGTDDTSMYYSYFIRDIDRDFHTIWESMKKDPVYHIFIKCLSIIFGHDFHAVLIVAAAIYIIPVCLLIKKESPNPMVSFVILITLGFFFFSMNGIRQSIALGFIVLAYKPLTDRKLLKFILCVAIAACFHKTALVFLLVYPMSKLGFTKFTIVCYLGIFLICLLSGGRVMKWIALNTAEYDPRIMTYNLGQVTLSYSGLIQLVCFTLFSWFNRKQLLLEDDRNGVLFHLMFFALIFQSMASVLAEMFRIAMYFSIFLIILIPKTLSVIPDYNRKTIQPALVTLLLIYFFFFNVGQNPYKFYWQDNVLL